MSAADRVSNPTPVHLPTPRRSEGFRAFIANLPPARLLFLGYLSYIVIGWLLLCTPFARRAAPVGALNNLFIATSAVSTTGLVTVSVSDSYTGFGQLVILALIQLGGIGYLTLGSFLILARRGELTASHINIGRSVFSMPESFRLDKFIPSVITFTLVIESLGAVAFYFALRNVGEPNPLWSAVFHSVSAFCTAGFSLYNSSFEAWAGDFWINLVIAVLSYLGAMGFIVCVDFYRALRGKITTTTLTTRIILWCTVWTSGLGAILLFLAEPSVQSLPPLERILAAFFQSMSAMTTVGFNTISIGGLSKASLLILTVLMIIGASPSGTGGGVKCTTVSAVWGVMRSALRGQREVRFWGRIVPNDRIWMACASLGFYLSALVLGVYLLELTEKHSFEANIFEAASALGTVGLSTGITPDLSTLGKLIVIALMFCGRVGPLSLGAALFGFHAQQPVTSDSDLAV